MVAITPQDEDLGGSYLGLASVLVVILGFISLLVWAGIAPLRKTEAAHAPAVPISHTESGTIPPGNAPEGAPLPGANLELSASTVLTRIAFGSGLDQQKPIPILQAVLAHRPQAFIFVGDAVLADIEEPGTGAPVASPLLIASAYGTLGTNPDFRVFRDGLPIFGTWGGHDYGLADAGAAFPYKTASKEAFLEFYGLGEGSERARREGVYGAYAFGPEGQRVQIILLDTRSFRSELRAASPGAPSTERYAPDPDPTKTMLGEAQWAWLEQQLIEPADVRLVVSPIQVLAEESGFERWGELPRERDRLIEIVRRSGAKNVVLLSGTRQAGAIYKDETALSYPLYEVTSSGLNTPLRTGGGAQPSAESEKRLIDQLYVEENFGAIDFDWQARSVNLELRDKSGGLIHGVSSPILPDEEP
jgi:alkaline phosphatase D